MSLKQSLMVEGNDDLHVISALCQKFDVPETFDIVDSKGIDPLLDTLPVSLKGPAETKAIGIVIDADTDMAARWNAVRKVLTDCGMYGDIPESCPSEGLILDPTLPDDIRFGAWLMPDNSSDGMLENFITLLIPDNDKLLATVDRTLTEIERDKLARYSMVHHEKARIHTWLAWQKSPGTPMGQAITKHYLTTEPAICGLFIDWLNRLFNRPQ